VHLLLLLWGLARELDAAQLADTERLAGTPTAVTGALRLLTSDLARPWRAEELASEVAVSPARTSPGSSTGPSVGH
jgi:transcriptional regulator GlxA family with amidase domain